MHTIEHNVSLKDLTTLKVGGKALFLIRIKNKEDILLAYNFAQEKKLPVFILGGGSNILVSDEGFSGVVLKIETKGIDIKEDGDNVLVSAEAGENWDNFVAKMVDKKIWGLENLSGIPGTVGASVVQNIGAYGREVKDLVSFVEIFDPELLTFKIIKNKDCDFSYRDSLFKKPKNKNLLVTKVFFKLSKIPSPNLTYKDLSNLFANKKILHPLEIREAVIRIRANKFPDLSVFGTAGSFFKNIIVEKEILKKLAEKHPEVVSFPLNNEKSKISSAWILDKICNIKGIQKGKVGLFEKQPIVLVNFGGATTKEIKIFAEEIKTLVKNKTGLTLEEEVANI